MPVSATAQLLKAIEHLQHAEDIINQVCLDEIDGEAETDDDFARMRDEHVLDGLRFDIDTVIETLIESYPCVLKEEA